MKRLLLSSASPGIGALPSLVGDETRALRFAFVPTAAGPEGEASEWVQADRRQLESLGCEVSTLDLAQVGPDEVEGALGGVDGVFLTGGNSFLLLWHARRSGFARSVVARVENGELLYVGTSAGGVVAGPDLEPAASPENRAKVPELDSSTGLALVDFSILPHDQEPERATRHAALVAAHPECRFVRVTDGQAILVRGNEVEVVDAPPPA